MSLSRLALGTCVLGSLAAVPFFAPATPIQLDPARIDAVFKAYTRSTPGCALGIYHDGRVAYQKGYGMADLSFDVPITPATIFDIGSTSKQFAAASIVLLANDGRIALADDVRKYIPELPEYGQTITIDHLLRHTSGLRDYNGLLFLAGFKYEDATDDDDALRLIALQKATNFTPGSKWDYSNTGFFLLSVIVKRVTGKNLAEFAKERLFVPLGMPKTHFRNDHAAIVKARATAYDPTEGGFQIDMSNWDQLGDGAVNTNVVEMAKWDENFYTGKVGGRPLIDKLYQRGTLSTGDSLSYARGLFVDTYRGVRRIHHGGAWAGYRAMLMRFPDQHLSVATLCNRSDANTSKLAEGVADVVLGNVFKAAERKAGATTGAAKAGVAGSAGGNVARFAGLYFGEASQSVIHIDQKDGKLELGFSGLKLPLKPAGENRFETDGFPVAVAFTGEEMEMWIAKETRGTFRRVTPVTLSGSDWNQLVGTYYSPELDTSWKLEMKDGKATLGGRAVGKNPLEPAFTDAFTSGPGLIRFTRDASGRLTGFDFSASRMQKIRFDRR